MNLPDEGRRLGRFLIIAFVTANLGAIVARADIVYDVDITITNTHPLLPLNQTDTIQGTITTDGTIGVIGPGNITSWSLNLIDGANSANDYLLTGGASANSTLVFDYGNTLTATATELLFDFSGASGAGEFLIQANDPGVGSGSRYFCISTGSIYCAPGETISPAYITADGANVIAADQQALAPAPEASSVVSLATMLLGVAFVARKRIGQVIRTNG